MRGQGLFVNIYCGYDMAKKRKREHKPSAPQPKPLEELLRNGEAVLYGQACWSIANRGTKRPTPGDVITLEGQDEEEYRAGERFRLTRKSVENVERCLGMRTCGEAVGLFVDEREEQPSDAPSGECPHGHR